MEICIILGAIAHIFYNVGGIEYKKPKFSRNKFHNRLKRNGLEIDIIQKFGLKDGHAP